MAPRDLWSDWTDDQLFQASTSDALGLCKSMSSAPEAVPSTEPQDTSHATISWNTFCNWHQGWTHNDAWAAETLQVAPSPPPCRCPMNIVERQVHDPWRKNTAGSKGTVTPVLACAKKQRGFGGLTAKDQGVPFLDVFEPPPAPADEPHALLLHCVARRVLPLLLVRQVHSCRLGQLRAQWSLDNVPMTFLEISTSVAATTFFYGRLNMGSSGSTPSTHEGRTWW